MAELSCLVTGGSGFLGQYVVRGLAGAGHRVTILSRSARADPRILVGDVGDPELDLGGRAFSAVYHVAGRAHLVPRTEEERQAFFAVNVDGTRNLLRALERTSRLPEVVVLISTVAVYGLEEGVGLNESTPRNASDPYGASKRQAEDLVAEWCARQRVRAAVVRLPLVAGRGAPGNLGAMVRALTRHRYLGVGTGCSRRSMVLAGDVGTILPRAAAVGGTFHLTDGYHPSFAELESALSAALRRKKPRRIPASLARAGARLGDGVQWVTGRRMPLTTRSLNKMMSTLTFSDEHARQQLGWKPARVLDHAAELVNRCS